METLGRYKVLKEVGRGSMGVIYLGYDPEIGRTVAIKTIRWDLIQANIGPEEALNRFTNEVKIVGQLQHLPIGLGGLAEPPLHLLRLAQETESDHRQVNITDPPIDVGIDAGGITVVELPKCCLIVLLRSLQQSVFVRHVTIALLPLMTQDSPKPYEAILTLLLAQRQLCAFVAIRCPERCAKTQVC